MMKKLCKFIALGILFLGLTCTIGQAKVIYPFNIDLKGHDLENIGAIDASKDITTATKVVTPEITTPTDTDLFLNPGGTGIVKTSKKIHGTTSLWWYIKYVDAFSITPGATGAQLTAPDANTLGGYQLDADTEKLYFNAHVFDNWDASSDLELVVVFEVNVDNTAGLATDTVDLRLVSYYKGDGETTNKTQTAEVATTVGQSPQYKQFTATFTIDWDATNNVVEVGDTISFVLNLETDTSEVDNIIVNSAVFRYRAIAMNPET